MQATNRTRDGHIQESMSEYLQHHLGLFGPDECQRGLDCNAFRV